MKSINNQVYLVIRGQAGEQVSDQISTKVGIEVRAKIRILISNQVWGGTFDDIWDQVKEIRNEVN
jgi:hypothetical protein